MKHNNILSYVFAVFGLVHLQACADSINPEAFAEQYQKQSSATSARLGQSHGRFRLTRTVSYDKSKKLVRTGAFQSDQGFKKFIVEKTERADGTVDNTRSIYCLSGDASFHLVDTTLEGNSRYKIISAGPDPRDMSTIQSMFGRYLDAPFTIPGGSLSKLMKGSTFQIRSLDEITDNHHPLIRLDYQLGDPKAPDLGTVRIDGNNGWVIVEAEVLHARMPGGAKVRLHVEYDSTSKSMGNPKRVTWDGGNGEINTFELLSLDFGPTPAEQFGMESYGLPDMLTSPAHPSRWKYLLWCGTTSLAGLLIAYLLRVAANRSKGSRPANALSS